MKESRNIRKKTIENYLGFLNGLKRIIENHESIHEYIKYSLVSNNTYRALLELGYIKKIGKNPKIKNGFIYELTIPAIEPFYARKIINCVNARAWAATIDSRKNSNFPLNENNIPPTLQAVKEYCALRKNNVNPEKWYSYYESVDWKIGKKKMINWKAAIHTWENQNYVFAKKNLKNFNDQELIEELKSRGYSGLLEQKKEIQF